MASSKLPPSFLKLLTTRVFILGLLALTFLMLTSSILAYFYLLKQHRLQLNTHLNNIRYELTKLENQALAEARFLSYQKRVIDLFPAQEAEVIQDIKSILQRHMHTTDVDHILITDIAGKLITSHPKYKSSPHITDERLDDSTAMKRAKNGLAGRSLERDEQGLAIVASMPIFLPNSDYRVSGAVTTEFHVDNAYLLEIKNRLGLDLAVIVNNNVTASTFPSSNNINAKHILEQSQPLSDITPATGDSLPTFGQISIHNTSYLTAISPIAGEDNYKAIGNIVLLERETALLNQILVFLAGLFLSFILTFTIVGALAYWIVRKVTQPLQSVSDALIEISNGSFPQISYINTSLETYHLTHAAENLSKTLKLDKEEINKAQQELTNYKDQLERLVEVRTLELTRQSEELIIARDAAEVASKSKSEFLSRMSHELRTPLNAILGFGELLAIEDDPPLTYDQKDQVNDIINAGKHLLDLINEILDISSIEAGKVDIHMEKIDLHDLISECITLLKPLAATNSIQIIDDINYNLYRSISADYIRVKQVFINLISNAIKYNHDFGKITLSSEITSDKKLLIAIKDTGYGFDESMSHRLFQPFERLTNTVHKAEGTGIGLALTKRLMELMGGEIGVHSALNEGATFWVSFNLAEEIINSADTTN